MFGFFRESRALAELLPFTDAVKFLLVRNGVHATKADWDDPYLYGYISGATGGLISLSGRKKLSQQSLGMVQGRAWEAITELPVRLYLERIVSLSSVRNAEWSRGFDKGLLFAVFKCGKVNDADPEVARALEAASATRRVREMATGEFVGLYEEAASLVFQRDLFEYMRSKLQNHAGAETSRPI